MGEKKNDRKKVLEHKRVKSTALDVVGKMFPEIGWQADAVSRMPCRNEHDET